MAAEASSDPARSGPLAPGPPIRLLGWLRPSAGRLRTVPLVISVGAWILLTLALGTWGFSVLHGDGRLNFPQSFWDSIRLYLLDTGPASYPRNDPGWQIWVAQLLAALLVLRGVLAIARERLRRGATRRLVRGHAVICGAGVHATRLAQALGASHDVVVIDREPAAHGMEGRPARYEWRLRGDCVRDETLLAAGVRNASWVVAMTGDDFVNSQVVSALRGMAQDGRTRSGLHVLVQVEDRTVARFLEEADSDDKSTEQPQTVPRSFVSPFSSNEIAAEALIDELGLGRETTDRPVGSETADRAPSLLLVGDHRVIDAIVFAALRRWRVAVLADREREVQAARPPLHLSVLGRGAIERVERLRTQLRPEPDLLLLEAKDSSAFAGPFSGLEGWLAAPGRADHAIVASRDELEGVALTLAVGRALGGRVPVTRLTSQLESVLDLHLEQRSGAGVRTDVKSIAELACDVQRMSRVGGPERLADALVADGRDPAAARAEAGALFSHRHALGLRTDTSWNIRPLERPMARAVLSGFAAGGAGGVPLSELVRAGLRIDLERPGNLRIAAEHLPEEPPDDRVIAWIEYAGALRDAGGPAGSAGMDPVARAVVALSAQVSAAPGPERGAPRAVIFAGAAGTMTAVGAEAITGLIEPALAGYEGTILCGGTADGVPGLVARAAARLGLSDRLVGYVPRGQGDRRIYPRLRETGGTAFSIREPLLMWADLLGSRIPIGNVRVVAFPGGQISLQEILLARALGATVAWLDPACEQQQTLDETLPFGAHGVLELPDDPMTVRAFICWSRLPDDLREPVARFIHNDYRRKQRAEKPPGDPALAPWSELLPSLRASNIAQADDIPSKLALIGRRLKNGGEPLRLDDHERAKLAEAEHGRWIIERLSAGWTPGQRHVPAAVTPDLKPWRDLDERTRRYDVEAVQTIAPALAACGWGTTDLA